MALAVQRCWARLRALSWPVAAGYHARPRVWGLDHIYKPDPDDPETKAWHKGPKYEARLYGRHGSASGVRPESLWPSPEQLRALQAEEAEWCPGLREMQGRLEAQERQLERARREREQLIAANMAKMPKMVEDWRRAKQEARQKARSERAHKKHLLALAREKLGVQIDIRSEKFKEMVKDLEKEEKKKLKAVKKKKHEEEKEAMEALMKSIPSAQTTAPPAPDPSG